MTSIIRNPEHRADVERAEVTRDDTAAVLVALLDTPATAGQILELRAGDTDVDTAVRAHS